MPDTEGFSNTDLEWLEDCIVQLSSRDIHWIKEEFRLIKTRNKITGKELIFLTNLDNLSAIEATASKWYTERAP